MVLERAHTTPLAQTGTDDEVARVAGQISRRLAIPAPEQLPRLQDQADAWEQQLRRDTAELPHVLPTVTVDAAVATVRELAYEQPDLLVHGDLNPRNILPATREPWLAVDPNKGTAGDPAYDCGTLIKSRSVVLAESGDLHTAVRRALDIFTEAAELDRERARRWAQLNAVQAAFWGRRHGFRRARKGAELKRLIALVDELAAVLTQLRRT